jgi:hypothetical protein
VELGDSLKTAACVFVVIFVELEGTDGSLIVNANECLGWGNGGGKESADCFLDGM